LDLKVLKREMFSIAREDLAISTANKVAMESDCKNVQETDTNNVKYSANYY